MKEKKRARRAVVVGSGIAGPVLGGFLRRAGFEVVLCEARPRDASEEGAFLGVAPNGMNILGELGVRAAVEAISIPCSGFQFENAAGRRIGSIDRSRDASQFGARLQMVRRARLHEVLTAAAVDRDVEVHFGRRLVALDRSNPSKVVARFADGSAEEGDVLIGSDGLRSVTRRLALPDSPEPAYTGLIDLGGFVTLPEVPLPPGVNVMVFGRRAFFGAFKTPGGEVWWFHNSGQKSLDGAAGDAAALRARMLELHRGEPAWIREVIEATPRVLGPWAFHDILSLPRWHVGHVCLIGDAAHATTPSAGQGASLALEDAMVLARCLGDVDEPEPAFANFERLRRPRVEPIVRQSRRIGATKAVSSPVGEWIRDRLLPFFLRFGANAQAKQYAYRIEWQNSSRRTRHGERAFESEGECQTRYIEHKADGEITCHSKREIT
jgi:2-polyprenyl-6-methoxyphenol hydroxylase-like FAD-dependent oxidoreductase